MVADKSFDDIYIGEKATHSKTISESDVYIFAGIVGDFNPMHVNEDFSRKTPFKKRIVHGMLSASLISTVFGTELPGGSSIYLSQEVVFRAPVFIGDTLTAEVEVIEKRPEKKIIIFYTRVFNQKGKTVVDGKAAIMKNK
ncbi:MAG: MaoC family dehydratase [Firmicutes bacterium]|nr:MaoC family dehydratase [Bacillota bacterium]